MTTEFHCDQYIDELVEDTIQYFFDNLTSIQSVYDIKQLIKDLFGDEYTLTIDQMICPLEVVEDKLITACDDNDEPTFGPLL